jgi:positive regulator of sigma E activity
MSVDGQVVYTDCGRIGVVAKRDARGCPSCAGACAWRRAERLDETVLEIDSGLEVGSRVSITLSGNSLVFCAGVVYGVPLVGMLAGAAAASAVFGTDTAAMIGTLIGLIVGYGSIAMMSRGLSHAALTGLAVRVRQ